MLACPPSPDRWVLRLLGWNALLLLVGVMLAAIAGEAYFRFTMPLEVSNSPWRFVPNVGLLRSPNTEVRSTNRLDYWNVSRTNSLGFLDREPPSPERAAATCHIAMIGDSFVDGAQVPIPDKSHVRLEELAADELPHLNITTSAFGIGDTGQVQQLPFYDEYARLLHPRLLVLVFVDNDFVNNTPVLRTLMLRGGIRENFLEPTVGRRSDGKLELAWSRPRDHVSSGLAPCPWPLCAACAVKEAVKRSLLAHQLCDRMRALFPSDHYRRLMFQLHVEALMRRHGYDGALLERWQSPLIWNALQYTHFALEQFKQRADRDGARLVILATHSLKVRATPIFERLSQMAATLDIPVIDQADYILRQGAKLSDANWPHDGHWNPAGHRWAAEALLEYIEEHPAICDGQSGAVRAAGQAAADHEGTHGVTPPSL